MFAGLHVLGQEEWLLQCLGDVGKVPSLEIPNGGVPRDDITINLQPRSLGALLYMHLDPTWVLPTLHKGGLFIFDSFLLLGLLLREHLSLLHFRHLPFLLQIRIREQVD